jgi:hypothetical protein
MSTPSAWRRHLEREAGAAGERPARATVLLPRVHRSRPELRANSSAASLTSTATIVGAGQPRALHHVEADTTAADATVSPARALNTAAHRCDAASDERQLVVERGRRRDAAHLGDDGEVGEAGHLAHVGQIPPGQRSRDVLSYNLPLVRACSSQRCG